MLPAGATTAKLRWIVPRLTAARTTPILETATTEMLWPLASATTETATTRVTSAFKSLARTPPHLFLS